jgi:hypothetical protein
MTEIVPVYKSLNIPTYLIWDSDENKPKGIPANKNILRIHGCPAEDYPCKLTDDFCCTKTNLEKTFRDEIGMTEFERIASEYCDREGLGKLQYVMENPYPVSQIIKLLREAGHDSLTLKGIVDKIVSKYDAIEKG